MIWMHLSLEQDSQLDSTLVARIDGEQDIQYSIFSTLYVVISK